MKTKFAREKSTYSHALSDVVNDKLSQVTRDASLFTMKKIEASIKSQGDEIIWIITTRNTNPMKDKTAPPMSQEDLEK